MLRTGDKEIEAGIYKEKQEVTRERRASVKERKNEYRKMQALSSLLVREYVSYICFSASIAKPIH